MVGNQTHTIVEIIVADSPFLTESVMMALSRLGVISHLMLHQPIALKRDDRRSCKQNSNES